MSDTTKELLINETYLRSLGFAFPEKALGKLLYWDNTAYSIVGVIADFHPRSLHEIITPLVLTTGTQEMAEINIAFESRNGKNWKSAVAKVERTWKELYPEAAFEYRFVDETVKEFYIADQKISRLLKWSAGLTIFISCLGLFGLIAYMSHQRTKEIGIRKVLGASINNIIALFSKDFIKLVSIAIAIATPIAWWLTNIWLQGFAFRIEAKMVDVFSRRFTHFAYCYVHCRYSGYKSCNG